MNKNKGPTILHEIKRKVYEHEVLFSFNGDISAEIFHDWWHLKGEELWLEWYEENRKDYNDS